MTPVVSSRSLALALLVLACAWPAAGVLASDASAELPRPQKVPALTAAPQPEDRSPEGRAPAPRPSGARAGESLDQLREKLAARLGAGPSPTARNPYVVRVPNKAAGPATPVSEGREPVRAGGSHGAPAGAHGAAVGAAGAGQASAALLSGGRLPLPGAAGADPHAGPAHWGYQGDAGPQAWASLKPEFGLCATGQRQSPIDIRGGIQVELEPIRFDYRETGFSVIDNGHTVQVNLPPGNAITVMNRRYELVQFHFHRPSEERINGRQFDMVAHLVHKDPEGRLAVVAVLLDRGSVQPVVQSVWNALPLEKGEEQPAGATLDLNQLLPTDKRYYTYMGSLTTPPCSEGVLWMVMKQPVPLSSDQINIFSRLYPMNARPLQQQAGRLIKESQ